MEHSGARVQEGAHSLRSERDCVPDQCRSPQKSDADGNTLLHFAAARAIIPRDNNAAEVKMLLRAGALKDVKNKVGGGGEGAE